MLPVPGMRIRKGNKTIIIDWVKNGDVGFHNIYDCEMKGEPGLDYWPLGLVTLDIFHRDIHLADGIKDAGGALISGRDWEESD